MKKTLLLFSTFLLLSASVAHGEATFAKIRQADKIAIALTGIPLTADLRAKIVNETLTLDALAEQLTKSDGFIEHFAQYWTKLIGMQSPLNIYDQGIVQRGQHLIDLDADSLDQGELSELINKYNKGPIELTITQDQKTCDDMPMIVWSNAKNQADHVVKKAVEQGKSNDGSNIQSGTLPLWQNVQKILQSSSADCDDKNLILIHPWWDPDKVTIDAKYVLNGAKFYKTTQGVIDRCKDPTNPKDDGKTLKGCILGFSNYYDRYLDTVNHDISMEPGYLIAHTVAENKPFSDVLTTKSTIFTGTLAYFMTTPTGKPFWSRFPGGKNYDTSAAFTSSTAVDRKHYWVARGPDNAGVLTTPGFQLITNGRRAKANRTYETFLCKRFVVPEGTLADPTDANPDLTKRAYCSVCHKTLEPMAAFFNRWPGTGETDYKYENANMTIDDTGRYNGTEGKGAAAFGKIVSETTGFDECGIRRAFEFVNGRKMSEADLSKKMPALLNQFEGNQKNLRLILKALVLAPEFLTPKASQP